MPTKKLKTFCCSSEREGARVKKIRENLALNEEVAESDKEMENIYKVRRIKHFQLIHNNRWQKKMLNWEISEVKHAIKFAYLQFIVSIADEIVLKVIGGELNLSDCSIIGGEINRELRSIGQELVVSDRGDNREVTWKKIHQICHFWIQSRLTQLSRKSDKKKLREKLLENEPRKR